jgi:hypothetical protein
VEEGGGKGAAGPGAHWEPAGGVGLAGGWPETMNFGGGGARFRRGIRDAGGDSRHFGPIPSRGRLQAVRRTFSARRAAGGHRISGSRWRPWTTMSSRERERERPTGKKGKGGQGERKGGGGRPGATLGGLSRRQEAGGGVGVSWELHAGAPVTQRRRHVYFADSPLALGSFPWNLKTALVCIA